MEKKRLMRSICFIVEQKSSERSPRNFASVDQSRLSIQETSVRKGKIKSELDRIYICEISSFAISSARNCTCTTAGSLIVKALLPNNSQTLSATFRAIHAAATCLNLIFYCSWCLASASRTMTLGDGGGGAVFGSFVAAAAVVALMIDMDGHRTNVLGFSRDLSTFLSLALAHSFFAADRSSFGRMISVVEQTVGATAGFDSSAEESVGQRL